MLHVQQFLDSKTFDDLTTELGITVKRHDTLPIVILNYDQIESPKTHAVVRECRALVLNTDTKEIVARSFPRFFNWGEVADEMPLFDFSDFIVQSKEDGSLCVLFCFDGRWYANTRGSFGIDNMQNQTFTWREGFCKALGINDLQDLDGRLDAKYTYIFEFCSAWNKIVRRYETPRMYLLTVFEGGRELPWGEVAQIDGPFLQPERYDFSSIEQVQQFLQDQAAADPTFEGVVIRDSANRRWKIKSSTYLGLHRLRGEGDNIFNPKNLLPFVMAGEEDELLTYFSEVTEAYNKLKSQVNADYDQMLGVWREFHAVESQKDFALAIQGKTPYTGVLFGLRKKLGKDQTEADLRKEWRSAESLILKNLK